MTLYELTAEYYSLLLYAEDPETDPQTFADTLEGLGGEIEDKADGYAKVIAELNSEATKLKAEIDRLTARKRAIEQNVTRMKDSLKQAMLMTGKTKFKTDLFSFNIQNNPPRVVIDDYAKIPAEFLIVQEPKIDSRAIKEFLSETDNKKSFFAHLEQGRSLRIR